MAETWSESLIKKAEGKIQSRVASFLALKEPIQKMTYHPNPEISNRAKQIYENQIALEVKLQSGLSLINEMKTSGFDLGKSLEVGNIAMEIDTHMKQAKIFLEGTSPVTQAPLISSSSKKFLQYAVVGLGVFFVGNLLLKGKST